MDTIKLKFYSNCTIKEFLDFLIRERYIIDKVLLNIFQNEEYLLVLDIEMKEFINLIKYLEKPFVSTQHGVKGEGHEKICFIAEDSSNPSIKIYDFFKMLCTSDISVSLTSFQKLYYEYNFQLSKIKEITNIAITSAKFKKENFEIIKAELIKFAEKVNNKFSDNQYYKYIMQEYYEDFLQTPNVTKAKECFRSTPIYGVLSAYRLFYVGCSRAKNILTVIVEYNKIMEFELQFKEKMKKIGFDIIN